MGGEELSIYKDSGYTLSCYDCSVVWKGEGLTVEMALEKSEHWYVEHEGHRTVGKVWRGRQVVVIGGSEK